MLLVICVIHSESLEILGNNHYPNVYKVQTHYILTLIEPGLVIKCTNLRIYTDTIKHIHLCLSDIETAGSLKILLFNLLASGIERLKKYVEKRQLFQHSLINHWGPRKRTTFFSKYFQ